MMKIDSARVPCCVDVIISMKFSANAIDYCQSEDQHSILEKTCELCVPTGPLASGGQIERRDGSMTNDCSDKPLNLASTRHGTLSLAAGGDCAIATMKNRQSRKIRELKDTLVGLGFISLDEQANVLGLCRSSAWSILKGNHKASGLSAMTINQLLAAPQLPAGVRAKILEYVEEKATGCYGHSTVQQRRFIARLSAEAIGRVHLEKLSGFRR